MSRKQKRYTSLLDVDAEMFKLKRKARELQARADAIETTAKGYIKMMNTAEEKGDDGGARYWYDQSEWEKKQAITVRKHINAINNTHLPRLVKTRAALQTVPMPFVDDKKGVTLEP